MNPKAVSTQRTPTIWLARMNSIREHIKRAAEYAEPAPPRRIKVESEDLEKTKRIADFDKGIINMGRL